MWDINQKTISGTLAFSGIGLHSGKKVTINLKPAEVDQGVVFCRTDLSDNNKILANFKNVSSARLCTKIENSSGASVSTIEHLMAAFYICGIDNILVEINAPEVPIMDGSSKDFVEGIRNCGLKKLNNLRLRHGLKTINPKFHNRYLDEKMFKIKGLKKLQENNQNLSILIYPLLIRYNFFSNF